MKNQKKQNKKLDKNNKGNIALVDGQNLHLCTQEVGWKVDHKKFMIYLKENYNVERAYYFLGYHNTDKHGNLYTALQESGFILEFKGTSLDFNLKSRKTGNVDVVFFAMKLLIDQAEDFDKFILVSGDGDYIKLVDYLIEKNRFEKLLFPSVKNKSSRYNKLGNKYVINLGGVRNLIAKNDILKKEKGA